MARPTYQLKLAKGLRDVSDESLLFFRQMGVEYVVMPTSYNTKVTRRGLVPATDKGPTPGRILRPWNAGELLRVKQRILSMGLKPEMVHLGGFDRILHDRPGQDEELENVKKCIHAAGKAGIPVVEYNFTPLRASEGYARTTGRGRAGLRDFDYDRIKNLPPLENVGTHTKEQMWERLTRFLKEVVPVAESANVRLAVHPNDPPVPVFRGAAQPLRSLADLKRLIQTVDSPSNGITLDTGVTTEMGEDATAAIRYFGSRDRINHVHFRNVRVQTPYYKYLEVFHDEGQCNMLACMKAFREVSYSRLIIPDHTPEFSGDTIGSQMGWAFALGYLQSLRHAAEGS
jgi:mannonate dehydratase